MHTGEAILTWLRTSSRGCALLFTLSLAPAAETPPVPEAALPSSMARDATNPPVFKVVGPGILELGKVRLNKQQRTVSFPAVLNMADGIIEYLLVAGYGKTHESILKTDASALHIHVAMVLLDAKGAGTNTLSSRPPEYGGTPGLKISGDPVAIEVRWREKGKEMARRAEELFVAKPGQARPEKVSWVYNGSLVWEGTFLAQDSGSLISLIPDAAALINNAGPSQNDDQTWIAKPENLPPGNTPIQVTIRLVGPRPGK